MLFNNYKLNWPLILAIACVLLGVFIFESSYLKIETDVISSLPTHDPILREARYVIEHLPFQDRLVIDLGLEKDHKENKNLLLEGAAFIEKKLLESGLFKSVGMKTFQEAMPELIEYIVHNLPIFFNEDELNELVKPLLTPEKIRESLAENLSQLVNLEGIGQSEFIRQDPLRLRNHVLAELSQILPSKNVEIYRGQLISSDGQHLLLVAKLKHAGTNSQFSLRISNLIDKIALELNQVFNPSGVTFILTPVGSYRAALDNEVMAKTDIKRAIIITIIGITFLLFFAFPRPFIGLLALIPSTAGTVLALFVCSLFFKSISILAVGFGGAIMSFTVDLGITYLLFLDRPYETSGKKVAQELWWAELLAALTTVGAFALLLMSDFQILAEIGVFSALGVTFTLIFVQAIFPLIFPTMPAAKKDSSPLLRKFIDRMVSSGGKYQAYGALVLALVMAFFAKPEFQMDFKSMNAITEATLAAENMIRDRWGDIYGKIYMMVEGKSSRELQQKNDALALMMAKEIKDGAIASVFLPSMIFPGEERMGQHVRAWQKFWTSDRTEHLQEYMKSASLELGFAPDAFDQFFHLMTNNNFTRVDIPERFFDLLGISMKEGGENWLQVSMLTPGPHYGAEDFYERNTTTGLTRIFDPVLFEQRMGKAFKSIFMEIALITGLGLILVVFLYFLDWRLSLMVLAPIVFALICTLGTLKLLGRPLDIPGLMLWIVIMGMGVDYSIYYVCSFQRFAAEDHPSMGLIHLAMFLASITTIIGFGALAIAHHPVLKSVGLTSFLGISYSIIGTFAILPALTKSLFLPFKCSAGSEEEVFPGSKQHKRRVLKHYRYLETYPRLFARFKMMLDPMFPRLADFLNSPANIMDIGCGYGVPAVWLLELFPKARVYGIEPDSYRARIASRVIGVRGHVEIGRAPDLPSVPDGIRFEAVLMLDMIHLIADDELLLAMERIYKKLDGGGTLIVRVMIPSGKSFPWERGLEKIRLHFQGLTPHLRSENQIKEMLSQANFEVLRVEPSARNREETWFIAKKLIRK